MIYCLHELALAMDSKLPARQLKRKIRHWTNVGLLPASINSKEGKGKHRGYDPSSLHLAQVLLIFDGLGICTSHMTRLLNSRQGLLYKGMYGGMVSVAPPLT